MKKTMDIVALGEVLIDFTQAGISENGMRLFEQNPGGAPANMLAAALQLGLKTAFIGKVGKDMHGDFLRETLENLGIYIKGLVSDENFFTTLAFVSLSKEGERNFSFARKPGADMMLEISDLDQEILRNTRVLHIGSLSLTNEPARSTTLEAIRIAKESGAWISYDPNYREKLWKSKEQAIENMKIVIPYADIMKISDEEIALLTPYNDPIMAGKYILQQGVKIIAITLGAKGCILGTQKEGEIILKNIAGFPSKVVDTTGAGDSFWGGLVSQILYQNIDILSPDISKLDYAAVYGNAMASLCVERRGGITGIPTKIEVEERIQAR